MESCNILKTNDSEMFKGWKGIPESIVLNSVLALLFIIILSVLRCIYFMRKPYDNWNIGWLPFIYGDRTIETLHSESNINAQHPNAYLPQCLHDHSSHAQNDSFEITFNVTDEVDDKSRERHQAKLDSVGQNRHWLLDYLLIEDRDICEHRGNDAFRYLLFQRYIIYFLGVQTVVCITILMPINIAGKENMRYNFEMTTINNIRSSPNFFWAHTVIAILMVVLGLVMMKKFSDLIYLQPSQIESRTILIKNIPQSKRNPRLLKNFFEKKFLGVEVHKITLTYDVKKLNELKMQQKVIQSSLVYCSKYREKYGYPLRVNPTFGSSCCANIDAHSYYLDQKKKCESEITVETDVTLSEPKHAVFVHFRDEIMTERILDYFEKKRHEYELKNYWLRLKRCCASELGIEYEYESYNYYNWVVKPAPLPDDIEWKDIIFNTDVLGVCDFMINVFIFIIFVFLTTPLVAMSFLDQIISKLSINEINFGTWKIQLAKYSSVVAFNLISVILPSVIILIVLSTPRDTKSEKNYRVMIGKYLFLLCMIFIFPSIGLSSSPSHFLLWFRGLVLIMKIFKTQEFSQKNLYACLFPPESSAWFVLMIISSILCTTTLEIMRLSELCEYLLYCIVYPRTEAEYTKARMKVSFNFCYASNYARFLLIFTIVTAYSVACPLITAFGLVYMLFKYLVDRYCIYYLYRTPVISWDIHRMAVMFVLCAFLFLLLQLTAFLNSRIEFSFTFKPSIVCIGALFVYMLLLIIVMCFYSSIYAKKKCAPVSGNSVASRIPKSLKGQSRAITKNSKKRQRPLMNSLKKSKKSTRISKKSVKKSSKQKRTGKFKT